MEGKVVVSEKAMWVLCLVLLSLYVGEVRAAPQVPCFFVFGDSLVDNGNNNAIASLARSNYLPYGIDYPSGPTGRFSNGVTSIDVIGKLLGFNGSPPPFTSARGRTILSGVNYASAAGGIREETGRNLGARVSFGGQLNNFRTTIAQLGGFLGGANATASYLAQCVFSVGMGSNDYLNNYFMPLYYNTGRQYTTQQYANLLIQQYSQQLRTLYSYGARKIAVTGLGEIGCSPYELARGSSNGVTCVDNINAAVRLFNEKVKSLVDDFNRNLPGAKFILINAYGIFSDISVNKASYGIKVINRGCCGVGRNNGQITCLPLQTPCGNRKEYLFWDAFHPTEIANVLFGRRAYRAKSSSDAYPYDIQRLANA
ncbi:hypothetical protein Syun_009058 [Stephania yunnanensis]|uniref:Uncharacterized protein n=1 Tax=Stephania yunnanensis TaxID=152371 RepID=A0AAP0KFW0_9MAGN